MMVNNNKFLFRTYNFITGRKNKLILKGKVSGTFNVYGKNNVIIVEKGCTLRKTTFRIFGNNNRIVFNGGGM